MVFCSSSSCGWVSMSNWPVTWNSWPSSRAMEISFAGRSRIGSPIARSAWAKSAENACVARSPPRNAHPRRAGNRLDEAPQDLREEAPLLQGEPPHDAEIHRDDIALRIDEQIAGMHVGVEEAVAHRMAEKALDQPVAEPWSRGGRLQRRRGR